MELVAVKTIVAEVTNPATEISLAEALEMYGAESGVEMREPIRSSSRRAPTSWAAFPRRPPSRSSCRRSAKPSARTYSWNSPARGRTGELRRQAHRRATWSSTWARPRPACPRRSNPSSRSFSVGDRVRCVITRRREERQGPASWCRAPIPELVIGLFEQEVPEIYDNTVIIKGCAREAGERTKIAVSAATATWITSAPASA